MKKVIGTLLVFVIGIVVLAPAKPAEAQVTYTLNCCDSSAVIRCTLINWTPVGNPCFCYGQGWGYAC